MEFRLENLNKGIDVDHDTKEKIAKYFTPNIFNYFYYVYIPICVCISVFIFITMFSYVIPLIWELYKLMLEVTPRIEYTLDGKEILMLNYVYNPTQCLFYMILLVIYLIAFNVCFVRLYLIIGDFITDILWNIPDNITNGTYYFVVLNDIEFDNTQKFVYYNGLKIKITNKIRKARNNGNITYLLYYVKKLDKYPTKFNRCKHKVVILPVEKETENISVKV